MNWYLETDRIKLRPIVKTDGPNLYTLDSDPEVMRFLSPEHKTLEGAIEDAIKVAELNEKLNNELGLFAAIENKSNQFIGWFILRPDKKNLDNHRNLEIGYRLMKVFWGKGYGTEVSLALMEKAQRDFKAERVYAAAMKGNIASINIMKKIGLKFEKEYIEESFHGDDKTAVLYSIKFK